MSFKENMRSKSMSRYIDAEALVKYANNQKDKTVDANDIMRFSTADVVKVVRCKDCIHYDEHNRWQCDRFGQSVNADDYCSYGERK